MYDFMRLYTALYGFIQIVCVCTTLCGFMQLYTALYGLRLYTALYGLYGFIDARLKLIWINVTRYIALYGCIRLYTALQMHE